MHRSNRLFEIILLLRRAKRPITADTMAQTLEVTVRTVYRDIAALQSLHVPIEGEAGIGYRMRAGFDLPPLMLTWDEVEAISLGLTLLRRTGDKGLLQAAQRVKRKIASVVPKELQAVFDLSTLQASSYGIAAPTTVDLARLRAAIRSEQKLRIGYQSEDGQTSQRTVQPLAVFYYVEVVVLVAWCELRKGFRHFRVDRISECAELDAFFHSQGESLRVQWLASKATLQQE